MAARRTCGWLGFSLVIVALVAAAWPAAARAQDEARRLFVLIVADSYGQNIGPGADMDGQKMASLFNGVFANRRDRLHLTYYSHQDATPDKIRRYYQTIQSTEQDALAFFYTGHGGMNAQTQEHFLTMNAGALGRNELRQLMGGKRPRLNVILSNCCSSYFDGVTGDNEQTSDFGPDWRVMDDLFLRHRGWVDITAAAPGTYGWFDGTGGIFTNALVHKACSPFAWIDTNRNGFAEWSEFYGQVREETNAVFMNLRNMTDPQHLIRRSDSQLPHAFYLPHGAGMAPQQQQQQRQQPFQCLKYVSFQNKKNEAIRIGLRYQGLNEFNQWEWFPRGGGWVELDVAPGQVVTATDGSGYIRTNWIQMNAVAASGNASGWQTIPVVTQPYAAATLDTFVQGVR
jgi:hypothetical protein